MASETTTTQLIAALPGGATRANLARLLYHVETLAICAATPGPASKVLEIETANSLALFAEGYLRALTTPTRLYTTVQAPDGLWHIESDGEPARNGLGIITCRERWVMRVWADRNGYAFAPEEYRD